MPPSKACIHTYGSRFSAPSLPIPFPRVPVEEAFSRYGTDAPDVRFGLEIIDVTEEVKCATYDIFQKILGKKGIIVCINLRSSLVKEKTLDANVGRKQVDRLIEWAKQAGHGRVDLDEDDRGRPPVQHREVLPR